MDSVMGQTFEYPNLVAGTDGWSDWWHPVVGANNSTNKFFEVVFPRAIEAGDVVCASAEYEFDGLNLTSKEASITVQGIVDGSWGYVNPVTLAIYRCWPASMRNGTTLDGTHIFSGAFDVSRGTYDQQYNKTPVGHKNFRCDMRVNYCGGGCLRVRRLMVTLNGDGTPHAWAPAEGEVWP